MAKILFLNFSPRATIHRMTHTGSSSGTANLVKGLQATGHQVISVISGELKRELQAKAAFQRLRQLLPAAASTVMSTVYEMAHHWLTYSDLVALSRNSRVDFVYERFAPFHQRASEVARLLDAPYIVEIHGPSSDRGRFGPDHFARTADRIQETVIRRADAVRVVSTAVRTYYEKRDIPAAKMHVLPNAADVRLFDPDLADPDVKPRLGLSDNTVIGFVGSMHPYHGLDILLEAASMICRKLSRVRFLVVGPVGPKLESALEREGLAHSFTLTGVVPQWEVPHYIGAMDICVVPDSNWYGSPIKLFEYGAMGKPVVAPHLGPVEDVVEHGRTALLFERGDVRGFVRAMLELMRNKTLAKSLAANWGREVRRRHTWVERAHQILQVYEAVA